MVVNLDHGAPQMKSQQAWRNDNTDEAAIAWHALTHALNAG